MRVGRLSTKKNSGFTLVELIIVIAIIAILTAVAAPQYVKYVDKARLAKDQNEAASLQTIVLAHLVDVNSNGDVIDNIDSATIEFTASGVSIAALTGGTNGESKLQEKIEANFGTMNGITVTNQGSYDANCQKYTVAIADGKLDTTNTKWSAS